MSETDESAPGRVRRRTVLAVGVTAAAFGAATVLATRPGWRGGDPAPTSPATGHPTPPATPIDPATVIRVDADGTPHADLPDWTPPGFARVTDVLATDGVTIAHRGSSTRYPEGSFVAYTDAVLRGYGALEVSIARTSDGVLFALHDAALDRTSLGTDSSTLFASKLTWAEVQRHQNATGSDHSPAPYLKLDDLVAAFGSTHVFLLDPKALAAGPALDAYFAAATALGPERVILKNAGVGHPKLTAFAKAGGFTTWGYFYPSDMADGTFEKQQANWTILGMSLTAEQAIWDRVKQSGKLVYGHIARSQTEYDLARAKGADGVMVGAPHLVRAIGARR